MNDITIGVNTAYKKYFGAFKKAYKDKKEVSELLYKCGLPTHSHNIFFLDFGFEIAVAHAANGRNFFIDDWVSP